MLPPSATPRPTKPAAIGYLAIVEDRHHGYTGGLLLVCDRGRPLEFHCTEPVHPTRAEQILYGPTLRPHVGGERIGATLVGKSRLPIGLLVVEDAAFRAAGVSHGVATATIGEIEAMADNRDNDRGEPLPTTVATLLARLANSIDPVEPMERVRDAIREAQRLGVATAGPTSDAA